MLCGEVNNLFGTSQRQRERKKIVYESDGVYAHAANKFQDNSLSISHIRDPMESPSGSYFSPRRPRASKRSSLRSLTLSLALNRLPIERSLHQFCELAKSFSLLVRGTFSLCTNTLPLYIRIAQNSYTHTFFSPCVKSIQSLRALARSLVNWPTSHHWLTYIYRPPRPGFSCARARNGEKDLIPARKISPPTSYHSRAESQWVRLMGIQAERQHGCL